LIFKNSISSLSLIVNKRVLLAFQGRYYGNNQGVNILVEDVPTVNLPQLRAGSVGPNGVLTPPPPPKVVIPKISPQELENIAEKSVEKFKERVDRIKDILYNKKVNCTHT
jgi:hypothetical protein